MLDGGKLKCLYLHYREICRVIFSGVNETKMKYLTEINKVNIKLFVSNSIKYSRCRCKHCLQS